MKPKGICLQENTVFFRNRQLTIRIDRIVSAEELNVFIQNNFKRHQNHLAPRMNSQIINAIAKKYQEISAAYYKEHKAFIKKEVPKKSRKLFSFKRTEEPQKTEMPLPPALDFSGLILKRIVFPEGLDLRNARFHTTHLSNCTFVTQKVDRQAVYDNAYLKNVTFHDNLGSVTFAGNY